MERLAPDILFCLFAGDVQTVDIHERPDAVHFGVDAGDPGNMASYFKELRKPDGSESGVKTPLPWKNGSSNARAIDMADLASKESANNSAQFAVAMIEGVEKVWLLRQPQKSLRAA
jgi:hypothetical protein